MRIIATQGTRRFTAASLAREVGISDGALFRHFPSMDAIVDAVVERMDALLFPGFPTGITDPIERLGNFFHQRVKTIREHPDLSRLLLSNHLAQLAGTAHAGRVEEFKAHSQDFVSSCLREARRNGQLCDLPGTEGGTILVLGAILALAHTRERFERSDKTNRLTNDVWATLELVFRGNGQTIAGRKK